MGQQLILDRYRPLEELGEGAFGSVVLAWDTRMQRRAAIKRLPLPLDERGRPHRPVGLAEARTAAMLNHPNIVTVFDFDTDADEAFLVMEYAEGASLAEVLDDVGGPLTVDEAAALVNDVAAALEFAHENGVLHLDIKPENVLITRDGRVKVADFGIAELSSLAGHGVAFGGTPGYMPLEQLEGREVTDLADEWAFAALTYEALTGDNPFAADTIESAIVRVQVFDPPLPSSYESQLPHGIDDVLLAALGPHPDERYPSVGDFADALMPHLGDPRVGAASLAELVEAYTDDDPDAHHGTSIGLWDRLRGPLGVVLVRAVAAIEAGWLAWGGLAPSPLEPLAQAAGVGLVALAAALAPGLGIGLGVGCFVVGLAIAGSWLGATLVLLVGGAWWWLVARRSTSAAVLPLAAPVLSLARLSFAQPLIAGFSLPPLRAAVTGLLGGALTMLASAASAQSAPYLVVWPGYAVDVWSAGLGAANVQALLASPAAYLALLGWPLAAALMSLMCARATRLGAVIGAVGGSAILTIAYLLADRLSAQLTQVPGGYESDVLAVTVGASLILVVLVALLGAPVRAEEEEPFALTLRHEDDR